ncbi:MAG: hypothetical protein QXQ30_02500 [Candidatus Pacearchaeota archaeon]
MRVELKPKFFSEIISIISQLVSEVNLQFDKNGLKIMALDPASVAMVILEMPKSSFLDYKVEKEMIAINLDDLKQVLKRLEKAENIVMEREDNVFKIYSKDGIRRRFNLALINIEEEERPSLNLTFSSFVEMSSELFKDAIEDCSIIADACSFITDDEVFKINATGTLNKSEIEFGSDEAKIKGKDKAKYSIEYLEKFIKASKIFDKVKINFKTDHPCQLDFFNEDSDIKLSFILAPRGIEEEE